MAYIGVTWFSSYIDKNINRGLPPEAATAYRLLSEGRVPDEGSLRTLVELLSAQSAPSDFKIQIVTLVCGLFSALVCAVVGVYPGCAAAFRDRNDGKLRDIVDFEGGFIDRHSDAPMGRGSGVVMPEQQRGERRDRADQARRNERRVISGQLAEHV